MFNVRLADDHQYGNGYSLAQKAFAGDVVDGVLFCAVLLPT